MISSFSKKDIVNLVNIRVYNSNKDHIKIYCKV